VARDGQQPSRNRRTPLEGGSFAPDIEEDIAQEVVGEGFIAHQTQQPAVDRQAMPRKQRSHGKLIAVCDPSD
jgi:hypothetical protein